MQSFLLVTSGEAALQMPHTHSSPQAPSMRLRVNAPLMTKLMSPV